MIKNLKIVKLKTGEEMKIKLIIPPEEKYAEILYHFLDHKSDYSLRDIKQKLQGDYAEYCIDKYFVGEINGRIASQIWYGYPIDGTGIGNFGHVYTEIEDRKKGITKELMKCVMKDFKKSSAISLLCGAATPWIANIYTKFGFQIIRKGKNFGPLLLVKDEYAKDFNELEDKYYKPGYNIRVVKGTMKQRHDIDKLLVDSFIVKGIEWNRISMSYHVSSYQNALQMVEDKKGILAIAETIYGKVVGWGYILNTGSVFEENSKVFDFLLHPNYSSKSKELINGMLELAGNNNIKNMYSYMPSCEIGKINSLIKEGFTEIARIDDYCQGNNHVHDLVILKK